MWNCVCGKYIYVFGIVGRPRQVSTPEPCGGSGPCTTTNPFYSTCTCGSPSIYSNDNLLIYFYILYIYAYHDQYAKTKQNPNDEYQIRHVLHNIIVFCPKISIVRSNEMTTQVLKMSGLLHYTVSCNCRGLHHRNLSS